MSSWARSWRWVTSNGLKKGDRVVIPFPISCGNCWPCAVRRPRCATIQTRMPAQPKNCMGQRLGDLRLLAHLRRIRGRSGGIRPGAVRGFRSVQSTDQLTDEQVLFLTDIFPTGYMAAENCGIEPGDTVAVWGCGPVGLFAIRSCFLLKAERVIALDRFPARLRLAEQSGAEALDYEGIDVIEILRQKTGGRGPDHCIDAVGMEAHGTTPSAIYDQVKQTIRLETDRPHVLRQAIQACGKGGTVSIPGVYGGFIDKMPIGAAFAKGLTFKMGQTHVHKYMPKLLKHIEDGDIDPSFIITHRVGLDQAPKAYDTFLKKEDECIKVVMKPQ